MPALVRKSALVVLCLQILGCGLAQADDGLDTSKLPRAAGAKELFANASSTIYTTPLSVPQTADSVRNALRASGWQQFAPNASAQPATNEMQISTFRKGSYAISVMVNTAPAQNNATSVNYTATLMRHDLPFTADATDIVYDPDRPTLSLMTSGSLDQTLAFFRTELGARGWSRWTSKGGKQTGMDGPAGEVTDHGAFSYYVRDNAQPMILLLQRKPDGRLWTEIKPVPPSLLNSLVADKPEPVKPQVVAAPAPQRTAVDDAIDAALNDAMKGASAAITQAMSDINKPAPKAAPNARVAQADGPALRASTEAKAPIPVPEGVTDVEVNATDGKLEFESSESVRALANFYRTTLKAAGWREKPSVINRPNMAMLEFSKGGKDISMTIMQMGNSSNVDAHGTGLIDETAVAAALANAPVETLEAEDKDGLPIPTKRSMSGMEKTPLRKNLTAMVESPLKSVLAFYRTELTKKGWKEDTTGAIEKPDQVALSFTTPDGPAQLKLNAKGMNTEVSLSTRSQSAAKANSGMVATTGQGKLLFGNINEDEAQITINKKTVKIGAGVGSKGPDGPTMDLPPGKYSFNYRIGGKPAKTDNVEVKAGETWGLMVGPGGVLVVQIN
jgi:hypothetical protein